uniref:Protein phosphatase 1 regulatory subunit 16A n=1 Tax=Culex pipiens TaxID=7175 RepID=A0A8D8FEL7_CULPI
MNLQKLMKNIQLMQCIKNNNINEAEELLNAGADANFVNLHGFNETPLHEAVLTGNPKIVQLLLARGADCEAKNAENKTPIDLCSLLDDQKKQIIEAVFQECANTSVKIVPRSHQESDPTNGTFHKRSGTANVGQYYETKLLTMVLCRILHDGKIGSFFLGNNLEEVGAFDDIVLKTSIGGH